jgi:hypothetical protein
MEKDVLGDLGVDGRLSLQRVLTKFWIKAWNVNPLKKATQLYAERLSHIQLTTDLGAGWTVRGSNSVRGKRFPRPSERPDRPWDPPSLIFGRYRYSFAGKGGWGGDMKLSTRLRLGLRLRMSGAKPPRALYSFMVWTRKTAFGFMTGDGKHWTSTATSCRLQCIIGRDHTEDKMGEHVHPKKAYGGRRGLAPLIPNLGL